MGDDVQRQLDEAVIPTSFSLESIKKDEAAAAGLRLMHEGWRLEDSQSMKDIVPAPLPLESPIRSGMARGSLPLITSDKTEFGLTFGRRDQQQGTHDEDARIRRGKQLGLYIGVKF